MRIRKNEDGREGLKKEQQSGKNGIWRDLSRGASKKIQHSDGPKRSKSETLWILRTMMVQEE